MSGNHSNVGVLLLRSALALGAIAGAAGTSQASPVIYDDILRNCQSAAQIINQGVITKDEKLFTNKGLGDWSSVALTHVDAQGGSGPMDAYADQFSTVGPDVISFMGNASLMGTSIMTPMLSADCSAGTFISVFFTVTEPVSYTRTVSGPVTGLFLHEEAPFEEISPPTGVLAPGKYSISAGVARRLDTDGSGLNFGTMTLRFTSVPAPGGAGLAAVAALAMARRRERQARR